VVAEKEVFHVSLRYISPLSNYIGMPAVPILTDYLRSIRQEIQVPGTYGQVRQTAAVMHTAFSTLTELCAVKQLVELTSNPYIAEVAVQCLLKLLADHSSKLS